MFISGTVPELGQIAFVYGCELRVIAGEAKGHHLKSVKSPRLRPTSSLAKSALFSMLDTVGIPGPVMLDLYSGTGALGIEALSRYVDWVDFVEEDARHCRLVRENLASTGFQDKGHVYCANVSKALSFLDKSYDIIMMDPPYRDTRIGAIVDKIAGSKLAKPGALLVVLHSSHVPLANAYGPMLLVKTRRHGDTSISIYKREAEL